MRHDGLHAVLGATFGKFLRYLSCYKLTESTSGAFGYVTMIGQGKIEKSSQSKRTMASSELRRWKRASCVVYEESWHSIKMTLALMTISTRLQCLATNIEPITCSRRAMLGEV